MGIEELVMELEGLGFHTKALTSGGKIRGKK